MWQLYSLVALFFGATEEVIDKATMVESKAIGLLAAAWIRNTIAFAISIVAAILIGGTLPNIIISLPIVTLGVLYGIGAITYTLVLKQVEITASSIMTSFIPLVFLPIDLFILDTHLFPLQIAGIFVLVLGAVIFFYRGKHTVSITKKQMLMLVLIFLFDALLIGFESYLFKDYFITLHLSETDFLVSMWGSMFLFLTLLVVGQALYKRKLPIMQLHTRYMRGSFFSKVTDYGNSFFFLKALSIASASQVTSMKVFYPIVLLAIVVGTQKRLTVNLEETLDRRALVSKAFGIIIICLGAFLVS